jgi:hypothetical protein
MLAVTIKHLQQQNNKFKGSVLVMEYTSWTVLGKINLYTYDLKLQ